jgi:hypothetical protein
MMMVAKEEDEYSFRKETEQGSSNVSLLKEDHHQE